VRTPDRDACYVARMNALVYRRRRRIELPEPFGCGVSFLEKLHRPGARLPTHSHAHPNLTWLVAGSVREEVDRRRIDCAPASVLFKPGGARHANRYGEIGARSFVIELPSPERIAAMKESRLLSEVGYFPSGPVASLTGALFREHRAYDRSSPLVIEDLLLQMISIGDPAPARATGVPGWLASVRERHHDEFERSLTLTELAREAGVNPDSLRRALRRCYGVRPGEYQRRLRVEWAARRTLNTSLPLGEIAHAAGFADQSHFNRAFRLAFGIPPGALRRA